MPRPPQGNHSQLPPAHLAAGQRTRRASAANRRAIVARRPAYEFQQSIAQPRPLRRPRRSRTAEMANARGRLPAAIRSEEHTSELQSRLHLVCRLLLEKKKKLLQAQQRLPALFNEQLSPYA